MSREKHPLAGSPVELTDGPHKGKYFIVVDWLQNQYHGKAMDRIHKVHPEITGEVVARKGLDDQIVWGKLYPLQTLIAVHDDDMKKVEPEHKKPKLMLIDGNALVGEATVKEIEDDTGQTSGDDSDDAGSTGDERCGVSGGTSDAEVPSRDKEAEQAARAVRGSGKRATKATGRKTRTDS